MTDQSHTLAREGRRLPAVPRRRRAAALAALATAQFMVVLDSSIINVAVPSIQDGLSLSGAQMSWVVDGYLVAFGGLLLLGGRLADVLRRRTVFLTGLWLFTVASVVCAAAPTGVVLIGARVAQGAGAAVMAPAALSIVMLLFPEPGDRSRALGLWGGVSGAGAIAGVLLGGLLSETLGWPWIFLINVPVGVLVGGVVLYSVRSFVAGGGSFDVVGALSVTVSMAAFAYGLVNGAHVGWTDRGTLITLVAGAVALGVFLGNERRAARPLIPLRVFRRQRLVAANGMTLLVGAVTVGLFYFLPQYQQLVLGMSPLTTSVVQLPIALSITVSSLLAPRIAIAIGPRTSLTTALASLALGLLWLAPAGADRTPTGLLGPFLLIGTGIGLCMVYLTTLAVDDAEPGEAGLLSGLVNTSRQMGGALGLAALVAVSASTTGTPDLSTVFLGIAVLACGALLLSLTPLVSSGPARGVGTR